MAYPTLDDIMTVTEPFRVSRDSDAPWVVLADGSMTGGSVSFGEARLPPQTSGPSYHVHENEDEAAYIVDGTMTFRIGDETFEAGAGTLVSDALKNAMDTRGQVKMDGTIFHSDPGTQYTAADFRKLCEQPRDRPVDRSHRGLLRVPESRARQPLPLRHESRAGAAIFAWTVRYNRRRLHSTIGMMPPVEWEARHAQTAPLPTPIAA